MNTELASIEESVLGSIMQDPVNRLNEAMQAGISSDWFTEPQSLWVWGKILDLHHEGFHPDAFLVNERIKRDGLRESVPSRVLAQMVVASAPTSLSFGDYLRTMMERMNARARQNLWADGGIARKTEDIDAERELAETITGTFATPGTTETIQSAAASFAAELQRGVVPDFGIPTGLIDCDRTLGTLQPGELILVAARTGVGKSSFVRQIASKVALDGRGVVMVSTEMGAREIAVAAAKQQTGVAWRKGDSLPGTEHTQFAAMVGRISVLSTFKLLETRSLSEMIARFELAMEAEFPPAMFVVDYVQQIDAKQQKGETLATAVGRISSALKSFALRRKVVVLAAAQLNREAVKDGEPQLIHLRDSGSLEQDADRVLMMKLETEDETTRFATVRVYQRKNRNGSQGSIRLNFDRWTTRFANHAQA